MTGLEQDRKLITDALTAAGWQLSDRGRAFHGAFFERHNAHKLTLEVQEGTNENKNRFFTLVVSPGFAQGLYLNVHYGEDVGKLAEAIKLLVSFQDAISPDNFKTYVRQLLKVCPKILLDLEEREHLVPLVDDESLGIPAIPEE